MAVPPSPARSTMPGTRLLKFQAWVRDRPLVKTPLATETANVRFMVTIDRDEDGMWVVECPSIPGCVSQGKTRSEALENVKEAIAACLAVRAERGMPLTVA